ncbi:MAG: T9SS type A sorting domain-containing protein [Ignavibacteriales bacterium]|nr:T9SS type A sorting domain-containing protein [Ignavibacteriales bacterium]
MVRFSKKFQVPVIVVFLSLLFFGWGGTGHTLINKKSTDGLPAEMSYLKSWSAYLGSHASDADYRKNDDPDEGVRHYIDIDFYDEFVATGQISQSMDSMAALHGYSVVVDNGTLPWTILKTTDSLTNLLRQKDWTRAKITAADLGHYVGDGHMPLHITMNYNGQLTGQTGVHSRYESTMIDANQAQLIFTVPGATYVQNKSQYVFGFIYENYRYKDSVLKADSAAKAKANGSTSSSVYKQELWARTKGFTIMLLGNASARLADLMYTAWKDAGSPDTTTFIDIIKSVNNVSDFALSAYPNPFNAQVTITFNNPLSHETNSEADLRLYTVTGREVMNKTIMLGRSESYRETVTMNDYPSGVYYVVLRSGSKMEAKKIVMLK